MKKALALVLSLIMLFALVACGSEKAAPAAEKEAAPAAEAAPAEETAPAEEAAAVTEPTDAEPVVNLNGDYAGAGEGTVLLTSVGQSADSATMGTLLKKAGVEYVDNGVATADDLDGVGVVFVAAGASTKGLGNAGITIEDEMARAEALLAACKEKGISVVCCHIGGSARRGGTSDQFIQLVMDYSNYMIVVADGNTDGLFTDYCAANSIPLTLVKSMANVLTPLGEIFG